MPQNERQIPIFPQILRQLDDFLLDFKILTTLIFTFKLLAMTLPAQVKKAPRAIMPEFDVDMLFSFALLVTFNTLREGNLFWKARCRAMVLADPDVPLSDALDYARRYKAIKYEIQGQRSIRIIRAKAALASAAIESMLLPKIESEFLETWKHAAIIGAGFSAPLVWSLYNDRPWGFIPNKNLTKHLDDMVAEARVKAWNARDDLRNKPHTRGDAKLTMS